MALRLQRHVLQHAAQPRGFGIICACKGQMRERQIFPHCRFAAKTLHQGCGKFGDADQRDARAAARWNRDFQVATCEIRLRNLGLAIDGIGRAN